MMDHTRKLYLTDDFNKVYKQLERPPSKVAKAQSSVQLTNVLENEELSDDEKVRQYIAALHRFLNVNTSSQQRQTSTSVKKIPTPSRIAQMRHRSRIRRIPIATLPPKLRSKSTPPPAAEFYYYSDYDYTDDDDDYYDIDDVTIKRLPPQKRTASAHFQEDDPRLASSSAKATKRTSQRVRKPGRYATGEWTT